MDDKTAPVYNAMPTVARYAPLGFAEFVALIAALMSLNASSIDLMLPALPSIGRDLLVTTPNDRQFIVTVFMLAMGVGSLIYGSLSDRFGRRNVLVWSIALFLLANLGASLAPSFAVLLLCRAVAGFCAAACRVVSVSIVRDCFAGDEMAKVMSLVTVIFIIVPMIAPSIGQLILTVAPWRWIFGFQTMMCLLLLIWLFRRLPETLDTEHRVEMHSADIIATLRVIVTHRSSMGYMIASGILMAGLIGFVTSAQQIFFDVFKAASIFPFAFAAIAGWMGVGSFFNSQLVEKFGARRLSQGALIVMIMLSSVHSAISWLGYETLISFVVMQGATMLCFAFAGANFSSISMEPFMCGAGMASSVQASLTTLIAVALGGFVGAQFNGTTLPLSLGFLVFGLSAFGIIFWAERGRLFTRPGLQALRRGNVTPLR